MTMNQFILHRHNGDEVFQLAKGSVRICRQPRGIVCLIVYAEAVDEPAQRLPDTAEACLAPIAECHFDITTTDISRLVGQRLTLPAEIEDDRMATVYYFAHEPSKNNAANILAMVENRLHLQWRGNAPEFSSEASKSMLGFEIEGWFEILPARVD